MYSGPNIAQPSGGAARTTLPVLGAILCGGLLLLLLAATIVLALIPIYVPQKTAILNANSKSSLVTTYLNAGGSGGRRRQASDDGGNIGNYVGGKFDDNSNTMVKTKFKNLLKSNNKVSDVLSLVCIVTNIDAKKRRHAFAKRATTTVIACSFYIQYVSSCISTGCQTVVSTSCTSLLVSGVSANTFSFAGINLLKSDGSTWITISVLKFTGFAVRPDIRPGKGAGNPATRPTIAGTPTTPASSPNVGG